VSADPFGGGPLSVEDRCAALLTEMAGLRDFTMPPADAELPAVHDVLREDLRPRLDRAEGIMRAMSGHRRRARRQVKRLREEAEEAYDAALGKMSNRAVSRQYESIRDREVLARIAASPQYRALREAERSLDLVEEAEEAAKGMFFGLRDIRAELLGDFSYLPWERSLER
jgi:hypothetical protein